MLLALAALALLMVMPGDLFSPGPLHKDHSGIESCFDCHHDFFAPAVTTCVTAGCHDATYWKKRKSVFVRHLETRGCLECHTEHLGPGAGITVAKPHDKAGGAPCADCHKATKRHIAIKTDDCGKCHILKGWRPARYEHSALDAQGNCVRCHKLPEKHYRTSSECSKCHGVEKWKPAKFDHKLAEAPAACAKCHPLPAKHIASTAECSECHGIEKWKPARFDHELAAERTTCVKCHPMPVRHVRSTDECAQCHKVSAWKPASVEHSRLDPAMRCDKCHKAGAKHVKVTADCLECHVTDNWKKINMRHRAVAKEAGCVVCHALPAKHFRTEGDCAPCHDTDKWKPARFDHRFPMNHEAKGGRAYECKVCHPVSYDKYDCYTGCHEHTPRNVMGEHLEEGIRDYQDCMKCHPTGREHEGRGERGERRESRGWRFWENDGDRDGKWDDD